MIKRKKKKESCFFHMRSDKDFDEKLNYISQKLGLSKTAMIKLLVNVYYDEQTKTNYKD